MTSIVSPLLRIIGRVTAPAILIAIGFLWFWYFPYLRSVQTRRAEFAKRLATTTQSVGTSDGLEAKLATLQTELFSLDQESKELRSRLESLPLALSPRTSDSNLTNSPANAIATTLEILRRHRLACIESGWVINSVKREERLISTSPKTQSRRDAPTEQKSKSEYRIRIEGSFDDVRLALRAIRTEQPNVVAVSIDMELRNPMSDQREWKLIVDL